MEPKFEPKQYTPEEIAQLEKSRAISDAELLKGGAGYVTSENGEKILNPSKGQIYGIKNLENNWRGLKEGEQKPITPEELATWYEKKINELKSYPVADVVLKFIDEFGDERTDIIDSMKKVEVVKMNGAYLLKFGRYTVPIENVKLLNRK